ncbi:hypothetical protein AB3464_25910 [Pseudomonas asplenii]|uniref:hypothetical protein n=1 Tax=Pseudomonas asplenii TaxID=53407 RepID=UPI0037C53C53
MSDLSGIPNNEENSEINSLNLESEQTIVSGEIKAAVQHLKESDPSLGDLLSSDNGEKVIDTISTLAISIIKEHHSSPYPSSRQLREINQELPDGANRLFTMTESEQKHRQDMEQSAQRHRQDMDRQLLELKREEFKLQYQISVTEETLKEKSLKVFGWQVFRRQTYALVLSLSVLAIGFWLMQHGEPGLAVTLIAANFVAIALAFLRDRKKDAGKNSSTPDSNEERQE